MGGQINNSVIGQSNKDLENSCTGCGLCASVCPQDCIEIRTNKAGFCRPFIIENKTCINCGRCKIYCTGYIVRKSKGEDEIRKSCFYGHSKNEEHRFLAASGGVATEFLVYLLKYDYIDYIVTADTYKNDRNAGFRIVENYEDIYNYRGSNYCPVPMGKAVSYIRNRKGKCAIVVLPCLASGIKNLLENDIILREKICFIISLFCNHIPSYNATEWLLEQNNFKENISTVTYRGRGWFGTFRAFGKSKNLEIPFSEYFGGGFSRYFWQKSCMNCLDHIGNSADISFGDADFVKYRSNESNVGESIFYINNKEVQYIIKKMQLDDIIIVESDIKKEEFFSIYGELIYKTKKGYKKILGRNKFERKIIDIINKDYIAQRVETIKGLIRKYF